MTYTEIIDTIQNKRRFGKEPGIDVTSRLLSEAKMSDEPVPFIHIAGTNGKGSVCAFTDSILRKAEYKVGLFTSPHLVDFRERIRVNGEMISEDDVVRLGEKILALPSAENATMFDLVFVMAALYFEEQECDFWIIETGLGGRLDSTNALGTPMVCAITSIGLDHMTYLGDTVAKIASEKAGIIKPETIACITANQHEEAMEVLEGACDEAEVMLIEMDPIEDEDLVLGLKGEYQKKNAGVAMGIINILCDLGYKILPADIEAGFKEASWPGRMDEICPGIFLDGAHNEPGADALCESLKELFPGEKFHFAFACSKDKDYKAILEKIAPLCEDIILTKSTNARSEEPGALLNVTNEAGLKAEICEDAKEALGLLKDRCADGKRGVCFGSLFFIGELMEK